jgi:hypothetical protein
MPTAADNAMKTIVSRRPTGRLSLWELSTTRIRHRIATDVSENLKGVVCRTLANQRVLLSSLLACNSDKSVDIGPVFANVSPGLTKLCY